MAYSINPDYCNGCGTCADSCPNDAIAEAGSVFAIDASKCKECTGTYATARCARVCPADACRPA
jgi:ferredoxin